MKVTLFLCFTIIVCSFNTHAQTSDSIDLVPSWSKNQEHTVKLRSITTDLENGQEKKFESSFDAKVVVKEISESGFKVEWTFSNAKLDNNDPNVENHVLAKLLNTKFLITLTDVGRFVELSNYAEVKPAADRAIDECLAKSASNPVMVPQYQTVKTLAATRQGFELILLKQIQFYYFSFGYNYKLNFTQTNNLKLPNQLGGQPFDAVEKITLTKLDRKDSVCVIESTKIIDPKIFKATVIDYVKKVTNSDPEAIAEMNKADIDFSESTLHEFDLKKSVVKKASIRRIMKFGFQNRTSLLEMESIHSTIPPR